MVIGYARVSTADQSLDLQIDALRARGCERIFTEHASGASSDRPELEHMLDVIREGDTLVVWKLDRLGRSLKDLIEKIEEFDRAGISFVSLQDNVDTSTAAGRLFFHMMASLAEFERDLIRERTRAGLAAARARGRNGGRPKADKSKVDAALKLYETGSMPVKEISEATGLGVTTLYKYINESKAAKQTQEAIA